MFLLDTNVISELRSGKRRQSAAVRAWADTIPANQLYLSSVSVLELDMGVLRIARKDGPQGTLLRAWFATVMQHSSIRCCHSRQQQRNCARRCMCLMRGASVIQ
jgi:hypothetical protein